MKTKKKTSLLSGFLDGPGAGKPSYKWLVLVVVLLFFTVNAFAQLPEGFVAKKLTLNNIRECVSMAHAPDGRIFLAERGGIVKVYQNGAVTTVHTVSTTTDSEQGLLGIALHSNFATNGKCYLYYTNTTRTRHYLDVIVVNASNQVVSNNNLMEFDPIINGFHNGGAMIFKDNYLYICIGESNDQATAQQLNTYMGKILRLLEDGQPAPGNPYYNTGVNRQQKSIWAIGMRNPWSMTMDPVTKKLYVMNVGAGWEEINDVTNPDASKNYDYGWGSDNRSGPDQFPTTIYPIFSYKRELAGWNAMTCAITSGTAFNPTSTNYPAQYRNKLYFTDWCTGWLRSLDMNNPGAGWQEFFPSGFSRILGTSTGVDGNIYYSEYGNTGNLWRLEYTLTTSPVIANHPISKTVIAADPVSFTVTASGTNPLTYQWQKNGVNIAGATSSTYSIASTVESDAGQYRVIVTNAFGTATSNAATLVVEPYNAPPVATITSPSSTTKWSVMDVINYSGTATDAEDGVIPASSYKWEVDLYHKDCASCEHAHPGPGAPDGVTSGSFVADNGGETSSNIWFRLYLTVTDSKGRVGKDSVDVYPNKVVVTVQSSTPGLQVIIGSDAITPYNKTLVVNTATTLLAVSPQALGDSMYTFSSFNHGGAASQNIRVPAVNTTYKANFTAAFIDRNLALNKPAFASTILGGNNAASAVDGKLNTRWESQFADPQWIYVDLGAVYNIARVRILWENAMSKDYRIEVSNDINNWGTPVKTVTGNSAAENNWPVSGTGRYVRIYGTTRTTAYGHSIWELEVYGAAAGGNQSPTVSISSPVNNASFTAPASITITATAADTDGSVTKVEFYKNNEATPIGTSTTSPYTFNWTGVAAGTYSITAKATDNANAVTTSAAVSVTVTNGTGNINLALNKPAFASTILGGNTAASAVDGILGTRWESQFADPQWIYVDLGAIYNIDRVKIIWENAMSKDYVIEVSNDINNWGAPVRTVTGNSITENDWTVAGTGRYVRVYGTTRATVYGHSIWELEVYGVAAGGNQSPTVSISSPSNNASFTAPASIAITAAAADTDGTITKVEFFKNNEATPIGTSTASPYTFNWTGVATGTYTITAKATDNSNAVTTSAAVTVTVTNGTGNINLALNKSAYASTIRGGNVAARAVDGITNTRWESLFADPQWIYVDLGATYNIDRVRILWENAKGKDYRIEISNDINNWGTPVKVVTGNNAADNNWTVAGSGRYVRIYGTARTTGYGYSIFELEVYGTSSLKVSTTADQGSTSEEMAIYPNPFTDEITVTAVFTTTQPVNVIIVNDAGFVVVDKSFDATDGTFEENISVADLKEGVYILKVISGKEVYSKKLIKQ